MSARKITPEVTTARFWERVERKGADECWVWTGTRNALGYGVLSIGKYRTERAHRYSAQIAGMDIKGMCVLHRCDNPPCVNPAHLFMGTRSDNSADKLAKDRQARGQLIGKKLSPEDIRQIRASLVAGETQKSVAHRFRVHQSNISRIASGETWRHVEEAS